MIVGLMGEKGCGKSTVANLLVQNNGFALVKFASPLKNMLRAIGLSDDEIEGEFKDTPSNLLCGKTPREAMDSLGIKWGRETIGPNFWLSLWEGQVQQHKLIVCDDCRFENEGEAILKRGGRLIGIRRPPHKIPRFVKEPYTHAEVINNSTIDKLYQKVYEKIWN